MSDKPTRSIRLDERWNAPRVTDAGQSKLLNEYGYCCLGILCEDVYGIDKRYLRGVTMPGSLEQSTTREIREKVHPLALRLNKKITTQELLDLIGKPVTKAVARHGHKQEPHNVGVILATINDSHKLTLPQKIRAIRILFRELLGVSVKWSDEVFAAAPESYYYLETVS